MPFPSLLSWIGRFELGDRSAFTPSAGHVLVRVPPAKSLDLAARWKPRVHDRAPFEGDAHYE
jgi:hypothetical protein